MLVKDLIKRLENFNSEAVVRLGGAEGEEVLFTAAKEKDNLNVWLETASMCDLSDEIATRFEAVKNGEITMEQNYRNLIELGITAMQVKEVMGKDVYDDMFYYCASSGLAREMGREDLFGVKRKQLEKMNMFD